MTAVPDRSHKVWRDLILKPEKHENLEFLAVKILLGRLLLKTKRDASPAIVTECVNELHGLFQKNAHHPALQRDLARAMT